MAAPDDAILVQQAIQLSVAPVFLLLVIAGLSCFQTEVCIATHRSQIDVLAFDARSPAPEALAV